MKFVKLDKVFEQQEKLIQVKLKSDPVKKDKSYTGYLVNETPEIKTEGFLNKLGNLQTSLARKNAKFRQMLRGDFTSWAGEDEKKKTLEKYSKKRKEKMKNRSLMDRVSRLEKKTKK